MYYLAGQVDLILTSRSDVAELGLLFCIGLGHVATIVLRTMLSWPQRVCVQFETPVPLSSWPYSVLCSWKVL